MFCQTKIIIIPVSYCYPFFKNSASERFRCDWLLRYLIADKYDGTQNLNKYDVIIYQKAHNDEMVKLSEKYQYKIQIFDSTDPEWLFDKDNNIRKIIKNVNFVTTSTESLQKGFRQYGKKVYVIPDRHELKFYKIKKKHINHVPILVWYGYSDNFEKIKSIIPIIKQYKLKLITICEKFVEYGDFIKWDINTINDEIIKGDIVINLPDDFGFKSNNKTTTAWLLGMPVVEQISDLFRFLDYKERIKESHYKYKIAKKFYNIKISVKEIKNLIHNFKKYEIN